MRYWPRDEFFKMSTDVSMGKYTMEGRVVFFGGPIDATEGATYSMSYFSEVPVFSDTVNSWLYTKQQALYRYSALMHADLHAVGEENQAALVKGIAEDIIMKLNADFMRSRASGSRLARGPRRTFG